MNQVVKIHVENGTPYVDAVPPGVEVEVTDYDVTIGTRVDANRKPCSQYTVTAEDIQRNVRNAA